MSSVSRAVGRKTMEFNKLIFGGLALGCLAAAAAGGYIAARSRTPMPGQTRRVAAPAEAAAPAPASRAVAESEGVITAEAPPRRPAPLLPRSAEAPAVVDRRVANPRRGRLAPHRRRREAPCPSRPTRTARNEPAAPSAPASQLAERAAACGRRAPASSPSGRQWLHASRNRRPAPEFIELVIPSDAVLGLQIERTVTSEVARVEDRVDARVTRDVRVGDRVAIPAGSLVQGSVMEVERGGKVRERAKLGIRFHTVVLADGTRLEHQDRLGRARRRVAGQRERGEDRRRGGGRRDSRRDPRRRQRRGHRRRHRRGWRHRRDDGGQPAIRRCCRRARR